MSYSSEIRKMFIGRKGIKIRLDFSPLGPELTDKEIIKWLNYVPNFQLNRIEYLSNKVASELTSNEIKELSHFRKDCKMASISKKYGNENIDKRDASEYIEYTKQKNLDFIIQKKLTSKEYNSAIEKIYHLINSLSFVELEEYCCEQKKNFEELSMEDSFILREISKELNRKIRNKREQMISSALEQNENMRQRSIERSKRNVF